ncbi:hypothetical protein AB0F64_39660 [Streptomyces sp. NPDC026294]|uniref:hypothetical protein n=2 Tax=unclassified Streptomyces TaxID=2593676 RepID=UPI0033F856E0
MLRKMLRGVSVVVLTSAAFALPSAATAAPQVSGSAARAAAAVPAAVQDPAAVHGPTATYGPYASFEVCWVAGNQGQQAGQWQSFFCAQNGTTSWWLFTTP